MSRRTPLAMEPRAQEALRAAYEEHYPTTLRMAGLLAGDREVAEELAQEAFIRIAPRIDQLSSEAVWPFLRRVVINLWRSHLRRLLLERRHSAPRGQSLEIHASSVEDREPLWRAILGLPTRQRACLVLRYYEDLSEREVARILGCSVGAVKSHTSRALAKLRKEVRDD